MKKVMILHTVKSVYETFGGQLREVLGNDVVINNILDDFLADDPARNDGVFSTENKMRLYNDLVNAQLAHPDVIVVSCSTLSPYIPSLRPFFSTPIIAIDDAMCGEALKTGNHIAVLATASSALHPAVDKLRAMGKEAGRNVTIVSYCDPTAIAALKAGDKATHDRLVLDMAKNVHDVDAVVLAQASMAGMQKEVAVLTDVPVFSSPRLCQEQVKATLLD